MKNNQNGLGTWIGVLSVCVLLLSPSAKATDELFENSSESPVLGLIEGAKTTLDIEIYTMGDPTVLAELENAMDRGVRVRVVQEATPVGATCKVFTVASSSDNAACAAEKSLVTDVLSHGGSYVPFPKALCGKPGSNCFEHGKMVIVDGAKVMLSTGNFDSTSLCDASAHPGNCDRDYSVVTDQTSVVQSLETIFENDLSGTQSDFSAIDPQLTVSPQSMKPITDFIASAKTSLLIENQYLEDPTMNQALVDAAGRGVSIQIVVASACSYGKPTTSAAKKWQNTYSVFDAAGIQSRGFTSKMKLNGVKGYLHAKAMIADGNRIWVGSVNGSTTALSNNREFGMFLSEPDLVSKLTGYLQSDFNNELGESWQDSLNCVND